MGATDPDVGGTPAERVVLSVPSDLSDRGHREIGRDHYRTYLRRVHDAVAVGDEFEEFTDVGCCGSTMRFTFRVEAVEGGTAIGPETAIEYAERSAGGAEGGWEVQNELTPDDG
ncbi:MAG: hypothetical protein ABEJ68_05175 [Halobacteriaceae archaeon]